MLLLFDQIRTFLFMFLFGFFSGFLFNIYQKIIDRCKIKKFLIHISDLSFSILLGILGFLILVFLNNGNFRFYVILAIILGLGVYYTLMKKWT